MMLLDTWRRLAPFVDNGRRKMLELSTSSLVVGLFEAGVVVIVVGVAGDITEGRSDMTRRVPVAGWQLTNGTLILIGIAAGLAAVVLHALMSREIAAMSSSVLRNSRDAILGRFFAATWDRQAADREGALQEAVSTLAAQASLLALHLISGVSAILSLAVLIAIALVVNPLVVAGVLVGGVGIFVLLRPLARLTHSRAASYVGANKHFNEDVARFTTLAADLRTFGVEDAARLQLADANANVGERMKSMRFSTRFGIFLYRDIAAVLLVASVGSLYVLDVQNVASIGAAILLVVRSLAYAQSVQSSLQQLQEQRPNLDVMIAELDSLAASEQHFGDSDVGEFQSLALKGVSFSYDREAPVLDAIDLEIDQFEVLGIVGESGAGKTTLLQLLLRLRRPTDGELLVNGVRLDEVAPASWSRLVSMVPQEPRLMEGSLTENIAFMRSWVTDDDIASAAAAAHIDRFINDLPHGYGTQLGSRGAGLSGGQKQRVAIARALAGRPGLLILDEPTSALDAQSEALIHETIRDLRGRVTIVVVTHRELTLTACDSVFRLGEGKLERVR